MSVDPPVPVDDGAADHRPGCKVPDLSLPSTLGGQLDLAVVASGLVVAYVYPRTGRPGEPLGPPTFDVAGMRLYRRLTFLARERRVVKVFTPCSRPSATPQTYSCGSRSPCRNSSL
jgi:hypothetical protein